MDEDELFDCWFEESAQIWALLFLVCGLLRWPCRGKTEIDARFGNVKIFDCEAVPAPD